MTPFARGGKIRMLPVAILALRGAALGASPVPSGVATFTPLPGPSAVSKDTAYAMSDDGAIIVGFSEASSLTVPVMWQNDLFSQLPVPPGRTGGSARGVTPDGSIIVGYSGSESSPRAAKWQSGTVSTLAAPAQNVSSAAMGVSANGSFIVGYSAILGARGPTWFSPPTSGYLASLTPGQSTFGIAEAVSPDGRFIVGSSVPASTPTPGTPQRACIWSDLDAPVQLPDAPGVLGPSYAFSLNRDATIVVGTAGKYAVRWVNGGVPDLLGSFSNISFFDNMAADLTENGRAIVGIGQASSAIPIAFLWREGLGIAPLQTVLETEFHLDLAGWALTAAVGVTPDGTAICGRGINPQGKMQAWVVRFAPPCPGDFNNTGTSDTVDLVYFLARFGQPIGSGEPADLNQDGEVNTADLIRFLGLFGRKC